MKGEGFLVLLFLLRNDTTKKISNLFTSTQNYIIKYLRKSIYTNSIL